MGARRDVEQAGERIEALLGELRAGASAPIVERVEELVHRLVDLYGAGLERIVEALAPPANSLPAVREALTNDPLVSALLVLHGLHPRDVVARVEQALESVKPTLAAHAGGVTLARIDADVAHLVLEGTCDGCPSSADTARDLLERAVRQAAPEITRIEVHGSVAAAERLIQLKPARGVSP